MRGTDVRHGADSALRRSPAQTLFRRRSARRLAVLAYHGIDDPAGFARQLDLLQREATPISLSDLDAALEGGPALPDRPVLVTFDDGEPSVLHEGLPLMEERGIPGVAFVMPGVFGTQEPFWWVEVQRRYDAGARSADAPAGSAARLVGWLKNVPDSRRLEVLTELREQQPDTTVATEQLDHDDLARLRAGGIEIGNHTWSHPCLDRCSSEEVQRQVSMAHESLRVTLGAAPTSFAYPNGNHDPRTEALLHELGYRTGFLFDHQLSSLPREVDQPLRISRLRVGTTTSLDRFATILSGLHPALHRVRGRS